MAVDQLVALGHDRSFTGDLTHDLGLTAPPSTSLLARPPSYRLTGRRTPPVRETPRTPGRGDSGSELLAALEDLAAHDVSLQLLQSTALGLGHAGEDEEEGDGVENSKDDEGHGQPDARDDAS